VSVALEAQPGVQSVEVIPVRQLVVVTLKPGGSMTAERLRSTIRAQGFATPKDPIVTVQGSLEHPEVLLLGAGKRLALEGAVGALRELTAGAEVTLTGTLRLASGSGGAAPALVVTDSRERRPK
jgi:hypothetical protein